MCRFHMAQLTGVTWPFSLFPEFFDVTGLRGHLVISKYEIYCLADPLFYDTLDTKREEHPDFAIAARPAPEGWAHAASGTWLHYAPAGATLPTQGWKIHISSSVPEAERVIAAAWDYCVPADWLSNSCAAGA